MLPWIFLMPRKSRIGQNGDPMSYRRGDIVWVNLDPTVGSEINKKRPAVIVSNDSANLRYHQLTVLPLTSQHIDKIEPFQVLIGRLESGLKKDSKALAEQIRTVSKLRFVERAGQLSPETLKKINEAIELHLGLE